MELGPGLRVTYRAGGGDCVLEADLSAFHADVARAAFSVQNGMTLEWAGGGEGLRLLRLTGAIPIDGGVPIVVDGKLVGAIGVSGGSGDQDGQIAKAGAVAGK